MGAVRKGGSFLMAAETGGEFGFRQWGKRHAAREACCLCVSMLAAPGMHGSV